MMQMTQPLHDTSHYDECRAIMHKNKYWHMRRFFLIVLFTLINGYFHIVTMPLWCAEEGVVAIAIFSFAFFWGALAILHNIAIAVLGLLATPEKPVLLWIALALVVLGLIFQLMTPVCAIPIGVLFVIALFSSKKVLWVKEQPGYPYFNERFAQQASIAFQDYRSDYDVDDRADGAAYDLAEATDIIPTPATAEMPDVEFLIPDVSHPVKTEIRPQPKPKMSEPDAAAASEVLAGVSPMYKTQTPAPKPAKKKGWMRRPAASEPEVPKADFSIPMDIPDPVWNVPDPVLDTKVVLSEVPEIAGDIQELPDIPDIPQI